MSINGIEMIVDRSQSDVDIAKAMIKKGLANMTDAEKEAFMNGLRGAYNYTDFNRIEATVQYLANRLKNIWVESEELADNLGVYWEKIFNYPYDKFAYDNITTKYDWTADDILNSAHRERYINNIKFVLCSFIDDISEIPNSLERMNFSGANAIEKYLVNLNDEIIKAKTNTDNLIVNTSKSWFFSGDLFGGEI